MRHITSSVMKKSNFERNQREHPFKDTVILMKNGLDFLSSMFKLRMKFKNYKNGK